MIDRTIAATPAVYRGVQFRSTLEAQWAAFFDIAGWPWAYEPRVPMDFWVPDFELRGARWPIYVEVKPVFIDESWRDAWPEEPELKKVLRNAPRIEQTEDGPAPPPYETLLLGMGPVHDFGSASEIVIGAFNSECWLGHDLAALWTGYGRLFDFCGDLGSFEHRISGEYDGDHHLQCVSPEKVAAAWSLAHSLVSLWKLP